jgi:redox-sensing transcriptional repressor
MESIDKIQGTFDLKSRDTKPTVSDAVIKRLPRYHRYLGDLLADGRLRISSAELSKIMNVTASQIRQDLNCFGGFGQQGYGYNIKYLYGKISELLGVTEGYTAVIAGAGNLGRALAATRMFGRRGVNRLAMFDIDENLVGTEIYGIPVYHIDELYDFCQKHGVTIGVLTVPKEAAYKVSLTMARAGVKGIWNFANTELELDVPGVTIENIHLGDSLMKLCYAIKTAGEERENNED